MTIQIKAVEQFFPVVLFVILCKVTLTFESVVEIPKCNYLNQSYGTVLFCGSVSHAVYDGSNF